ncbi:MAG TPA: SDR family oxidoreductase [Methylovirgula sp.]|jgi:hypothetical protein
MNRTVALITGASGGIGADLARVFAAHGHDLALVARSKDQLEALANEIAATGKPKPIVIVEDLAKPDAAETIAAALKAADASPDILVNNAGYGLLGDVADLDAAGQLGIIDVNNRALLALTIKFLPAIKAAHGKILNVASIVSFFPGPGMAVYYASKAFDLSFGHALGYELRKDGVTVTTLCPGVTTTGFQSRAGFHSGMMLMRLGAATSASVAEAGYAGTMAGRRTVIHGLANKLLCYTAPFLPSAILLPVIAAMQRSKS